MRWWTGDGIPTKCAVQPWRWKPSETHDPVEMQYLWAIVHRRATSGRQTDHPKNCRAGLALKGRSSGPGSAQMHPNDLEEGDHDGNRAGEERDRDSDEGPGGTILAACRQARGKQNGQQAEKEESAQAQSQTVARERVKVC